MKIMKLEYVPPTKNERLRQAWFKQHLKPGMTLTEVFRLNEEALRLFPATEEERQLKFESLKAMPEFVL